MRTNRISLLALLTVCLLAVLVSGTTSTTARHTSAKPFMGWFYVEIEAKLYRKGVEISSDNPSERRWYFSNVVTMPEDVPSYSLSKKKIMPYFSLNVMDPVESRGIALDYGEQDVRLNGETSVANYESKAEAEEARTKEIEYRKEQGGNIYSFELSFESAKGEETSKPKLIYRDKEQPLYDAAKP
jgi:hypothetical protein